LSELERAHIPTIAVGRDLTARRVYSVQVDNVAGGYAAAKHLYDLGHREIAVIRGPSELGDSDRRWQGIQRFAEEVGLTLAPERVVQLTAAIEPTAGFEEGFRLTTKMIERGVQFTAVLAFDDLTGLGVIRALRQACLRVPEDCSVIGFDDIPHATMNTPGLTTIRQPMEEMGSLAARWVLDALDDAKRVDAMSQGVNADGSTSEPAEEESSSALGILRLLPPELVIRESAGRFHLRESNRREKA
jgi:LacI family transcriptional regulator